MQSHPGLRDRRARTLCGWCSLEVMWSWTWSERCVVVHILSTVGTENTSNVKGCF